MTTTITIRDGIGYLGVDDPELLEKIVDATSFKIEGSAYRTRDRRADKRTKLVRNNKFPIGLLDRVCRAMATQDVVPQLSHADTQTAPKPSVVMKLLDVEPRDYQFEAQMAAVLNDRGIFRVPTGGGKSLIALMIAVARKHPTVIIVPTIDLLYQMKDYVAMHLVRSRPYEGERWHIGQLGDGVVDPQPFTVATMRTIANVVQVAYESYEYGEYDDSDSTKISDEERAKLRQWVQDIGCLIVDEAHQLGAKTLYDVVTKIPAICKYGLSASPWRDDGADLMIEAATGPCIFYVPAARLVEHKFLMAPEIRVVDTSKWWTSAAWGKICTNCNQQWLEWKPTCDCGSRNFRSQYDESYRKEIVENDIRNGKISQIIQELDRPTLALVKQVKHGRALSASIPNAIFLYGSVKGEDRKAVIDAVRTGLQKVIVCTTIGDMGLDIPNLGALVLAGGGKSSTRHLQRIGRVVRYRDGKPRPIVVDLDDSHIHPWYGRHAGRRRAIERAEWSDLATWVSV